MKIIILLGGDGILNRLINDFVNIQISSPQGFLKSQRKEVHDIVWGSVRSLPCSQLLFVAIRVSSH
ncbi:hypothetical protein Syun_001632 [Stephania yunnanensis]|uniref:Uncharacterized protein n=1 Tax=Stephania yunnanensis TaxID=152371 RepID=A0AAP0Q6G9_9MAGN